MNTKPIGHTNAFLTLNGKPFVLAEYLDDKQLIQLDRSLVKDEIIVDQSEAYRTIIDISIDDIGKKASDGSMNIIGNETKFNDLLGIIRANWRNLDRQLPVIKKGLVLRVNYQLENNRTGQIIRTLVEDLRINERTYFLDINPDNINDNAIVVNFSNTMVSTINQCTHGSDPMILRLTSIQLCYECLRPDPMTPRVAQYADPNLPHWCEYSPNAFEAGAAAWEYHENNQSHKDMGDGRVACYPNIPQGWIMYNRFYHFDNGGQDIVLHDQEIEDIHNKKVLYSCGKVQVNRAFLVNPGSRIIFKFSVWKNDVVITNDCRPVAEALNVFPMPPVPPCPKPEPPAPKPCPYPWPVPYWPYPPYPGKDKEFELLMKLFEMSKAEDKKQDREIRELAKTVKELAEAIRPHPHPPVPPTPPGPGPHPVPPHPHPMPPSIKAIMLMLKELQAKMDEVIEKTDIELNPISDQDIQDIINALEADYEDNGEYDGSVPMPFVNPDTGEVEYHDPEPTTEEPTDPQPEEPVDTPTDDDPLEEVPPIEEVQNDPVEDDDNVIENRHTSA